MLKRLYFGYDERSLFVRLESHTSLKGYLVELYVSRREGSSPDILESGVRRAALLRPSTGSASREISIRPEGPSIELSRWEEGSGWTRIQGQPMIVADDTVVEAAVPMDALEIELGMPVGLSIVVFKDNLVVQRLPEEDEIVLELSRVAVASN